MLKALSFSDVLILPSFSDINSRKDVDLTVNFMGEQLRLPILSAPMDTVTGTELAIELQKLGGLACLHRFQPIGDNVAQFEKVRLDSGLGPVVSVGLNDWERADALVEAGANKFILDVAHGGQLQVAHFAEVFLYRYKDCHLMLGNFSTETQISKVINSSAELIDYASLRSSPLSWRIGVGGGSACTTRIKTGCGMPTLASVINASCLRTPLVADGGMKTSGDIAKALAAGSTVVMLGGMLGGTTEAPGDLVDGESKKFRGSAAASSYKDQGKDWATAEGEEFLVPHKGPLKSVIDDIEGGLRSALCYVGARNLKEFRERAELIEITNAGQTESGPHGRKL